LLLAPVPFFGPVHLFFRHRRPYLVGLTDWFQFGVHFCLTIALVCDGGLTFLFYLHRRRFCFIQLQSGALSGSAVLIQFGSFCPGLAKKKWRAVSAGGRSKAKPSVV
jgi:hypothetical protein